MGGARVELSLPGAPRPRSAPLREHDGHAWRRCHPGWRRPRALAALQPELRPRAQGGCALRPALGTPVRVLRPPLPAPSNLRPWGSRAPAPCWLLSPSPQPGAGVRREREGRDTAARPIPTSRCLGGCARPRERKLGSDSPNFLLPPRLSPRGPPCSWLRVGFPGRRHPPWVPRHPEKPAPGDEQRGECPFPS